MTNLEIVSRIQTTLNLNVKDMRVPKRYILEIAKNKAILFMTQRFRDRSLFRESNLFYEIPCLELKEINKVSCGIYEFRKCEKVLRSVKKIPNIIYFRYGSSIKEVSNIDYSVQFKETTLSKLREDKKREEYRHQNSFLVKDDYLYIPDFTENIKYVSMLLYTPNEYDVFKLNSCNTEACVNPWNLRFNCSDKIKELVIQESIKELSFKLQIPIDENPNLDSNIKSQTTI